MTIFIIRPLQRRRKIKLDFLNNIVLRNNGFLQENRKGLNIMRNDGMVTTEYIDNLFSNVILVLERIEETLNRMITQKAIMDGDELLDNQDVCLFLGITKRTLQRYKQYKKLPYYMLNGISYYKKSEVMAFLDKKKG